MAYAPKGGKDPQVQLLGEKALLRMFTIRKNADFWKTVFSIQSVIPYELSQGQRRHKFTFRVLPEEKVKALDTVEFRCYKVFVKICFYIDTMYNYEVEEAEMEFLLDDKEKIWVIDITKTKILTKKGFEESTAVNGVTYCHPIGDDPELRAKEVKPQFSQKDISKLTADMDERIKTLDTDRILQEKAERENKQK